MSPAFDKSELRVFLSADLVGSTKLKNELNQQLLLEKLESRQHLIRLLHECQPGLELIADAESTALLQSLGIGTEDFDWVDVVQSFYSVFHDQFVFELTTSRKKHPALVEAKPWKAIGDELLYQFSINSREHLYWIIVSFLKALRRSDTKVREGDKANRGLRIKGAGWVAGFPVRNRVVQLPAVEVVDYLGPDLDAGFRLGRCTRPGMAVVSVELAELLGETPNLDPFLGMIVGWESLKGVWNDHLYPIIWVDLPQGIRDEHEELGARIFNDWQQKECRFCTSWESKDTKDQLRKIGEKLRSLRNQLSSTLGLVDPYIVAEGDEVPPAHRSILDLQAAIRSYLAEVRRQGTDEENASAMPIPEAQVEELVSGVLQEPASGERVDEE